MNGFHYDNPQSAIHNPQSLGAMYLGERRCRFRVWAPLVRKIELHLVHPQDRFERLQKTESGYHEAILDGVEPGSLYLYRLDDRNERPDPASRYQPQGVHRPSEVCDPAFPWEDACWFGLPLPEYVLYEIHVGAYTEEGTFDAIIPQLGYLEDLGITAIELMPVAQFPGERNWGYDGVHPFAVQSSYGGPAGLKRLVNACHRHHLAVVLDVVYNHLGTEGNYLGEFGPYFTDCYKTPWGPAINFDGPHSDDVRHYFIQNALYWFTDLHVDALRLDAVHAIKDFSATPFLEELGQAAQEKADEINRRLYLIAESDLNDARIIRPRNMGGYGLDAQWSDDFHHSVHALLTGETNGYYADFGRVEHLAKAYRECFVYDGAYSRHRKRRHGNSARLNEARQFVVCAQNHDQAGNRVEGERLSQLVSFEKLKLAAGAVLLSPFIPLLFMGEEYGETAPFLYFVSHSDPGLIEGVRRGRRAGFAALQCKGTPPDPQDKETFSRCKLRHDLRDAGRHGVLRDFYKELIALRKDLPRIDRVGQDGLESRGHETEKVLYLRRWRGLKEAILVFNFGDSPASATLPSGGWRKRMDSADPRWNGRGSPTPLMLKSDGEAEIPVSPLAFCLFLRTDQTSDLEPEV